MIETARQYLQSQYLTDINLISTVGFDDEDVRDIAALKSADEVMPGYIADLLTPQNGKEAVVRVISVPEKTETNEHPLNEPLLKEGRMPDKPGECVIEKYYLPFSGFHIGDTISFKPTVGETDALSMVKQLDFKIVGLVESPMYLTYLRGNTTVGEGSISYYVMIPSDGFAYERYTSVYVRTKASSSGYSDFSDEYKKMVENEKDEYSGLSETCIRRFNETTLTDARKKLADAQKEFDDKKQEALDELKKGSLDLIDGQAQYDEKITEGRKKLEDAQKELEEGRTKLEEGKKEYQEGIESGKQKLVDAQQQYSDGLAQYNSGKQEYDSKIQAAQIQLDAAQKEFDTQYHIFYTSTKPQAENKLSLLKTAIEVCESAIITAEGRLAEMKSRPVISVVLQREINALEQQLKEYSNQLDDLKRQYDDGMDQLENGEKQLLQAKNKLSAAQNEFETKKAEGAKQLAEARAKLDAAESQLAVGKLEYETAMNNGMLELQSAQSKLTEGALQLTAGKTELERQQQEGLQQLKDGRRSLEKGRYEARTKLGEAEDKLRDAQDSISTLEDAKWIVNTREDNPGYSGLVEDADRVDSICNVFPIFFLLVAGLVCLTTMTRMVEERRTEMGTLKALGYSVGDIAAKFLVYAGAAALSGSIVGSLIGVLTLPYIIVSTYGIMYSLPPTILVVSWSSMLISSIVGLICICAVSLLACYRDLRLVPAILMRPKAPKPGKRILLEWISPIWNHMNFLSKVTSRNLFRYKARFLMTVIGVAGCTALIVAAFGLKDSITGIADKQFKEVSAYDQVYALSKAETAEKKQYLMSQFHADKRFDHAALALIEWGYCTSPSRAEAVSGRIFVGENQEDFGSMFVLRDRVTHQSLSLTDDGVIINERLGNVLNISPGDTITMTVNDIPYKCRVDALTEAYAGNFIYMTPTFYEKLMGKEPLYSVIITHTAENYRDAESQISADYLKNDDILTVSSINDQINTMIDMLDSLNVVIFVMVFCAGLLAFVVLYNLTNINIAERVREIATIRVLGFYSMETASFIYRENIVLTIVGSLAGLLLGNLLSGFIVESIQMDNVMFPKEISWVAYFLGLALTFVFSMLVNFFMYFKMNKISMVESLKSID